MIDSKAQFQQHLLPSIVAFMLQKFSEDILYNRTKISDIDKKIRRFLISYFVDTSIKII